jgi:hypothetical protein
MKRLFPLLALLLSACSATTRTAIKPLSPSAAPKAPLSIGMMRSADGFGPMKFWHGCDGHVTVQMGRNPGDAVESLLRDTFETVETGENPKGDFIAYADGSETTAGLFVLDPETREYIAQIRYEFPRPQYRVAQGPCMLAIIPPFYFLFPIYANTKAGEYRRHYEHYWGEFLKGARSQLAEKIPGLLQFVRERKAAAQEEASADSALRTGDVQEAFDSYIAALKNLKAGSMRHTRLLDKFLPLVPKANPPELPEEARRRMTIAQTKFKDAKSQGDMQAAVNEFQLAVDAAPWWPSVYFNMAVAYEGAKNYKEAVATFKRYLAAAPNAPDAAAIRQRTYALEAK